MAFLSVSGIVICVDRELEHGCFGVSCVLPSDNVDVGRPRLCDLNVVSYAALFFRGGGRCVTPLKTAA